MDLQPDPSAAPGGAEDPQAGRTRRRHASLRLRKRARPGASPGTLIADPDAAVTTVSATLYGPETYAVSTPRDAAEIAALRGRAPTLWLNVTGLADIAFVRTVGEAFGLHDLALEDVVNVHQRPKVESFGDFLFIVARMPVAGGHGESEQVSFFLGRDFLLTFQERAGDSFDPVRDRLRRGKGRLRAAGADYLAYALVDAVIDGYFPVLESLGEVVERLEDEIIARPEPGQIDRLHAVRRSLLSVRRALWPMREMVNALIRDETPIVGHTTRLYLRDCYDHLVQLIDILETYREIASFLLEIYLSSQSARMNEIMKVLTVIATIFIPLGFVTGLYGMNFDREASPWNMPELGWPYGYLLVLALMAAIAGALLYGFWRRGWLGDGTRTKRRRRE